MKGVLIEEKTENFHWTQGHICDHDSTVLESNVFKLYIKLKNIHSMHSNQRDNHRRLAHYVPGAHDFGSVVWSPPLDMQCS